MDGTAVNSSVGGFQLGGHDSWGSIGDRGGNGSGEVGSRVGNGCWQGSSIGSVGRHLLVGQRSLQDRVGQVWGRSIAVGQGSQNRGTGAHGDGSKDDNGELWERMRRITKDQWRTIGCPLPSC